MNIFLLVPRIPSEESSSDLVVSIPMFQNAATRLGHNLTVVATDQCKMLFDKKPVILVDNERPKIDFLMTRPSFSAKNLPIHASVIRQFELAGIPVFNSYESIVAAKNKIRMLQKLSNGRIPMPKTYAIRSAQYIPEIMDDIGPFPVIVKASMGSGGIGVAIAESKRGLRSLVEMMMSDADEATPLIIQQYIRESSGQDIRVFIVGGKIVAAMERIATKKGEFRSNFSIGGKVRIASLSQQERRLAEKAAAAMDLDVAGVDLIRSKNGTKVLEVNCNPGLKGITGATGVDVAESILKYGIKTYGKKAGKKKPTTKKTSTVKKRKTTTKTKAKKK